MQPKGHLAKIFDKKNPKIKLLKIINIKDPLVILAKSMNWDYFKNRFGKTYNSAIGPKALIQD